MPERPNIVFLVLDTARARSLSPYNISGAETPFLSKLAEDNLFYEQAISPAPWTLPAHVSMFTGLTPTEHQVNSWEDRLSKESTTLAGLLSDSGYQTTGFSHNMWLSNTFGLTTGFQDFNEQWQLIQSETNLFNTAHHLQGLSFTEKVKQISSDIFSNNPLANVINAIYAKFIHNRSDHGANQTNKNIKKWLNKEWDQSKPFFLFANYLEPHIEYDPPKEYVDKYCDGVSVKDAKEIPQEPVKHILGDIQLSQDDFESLRALYKGELDYLDQKIREVFGILSDVGALENSVVIVVGDHGENLGENGLMSHMYSLHENLIRVPCIIKTPERKDQDIEEPIQTHDLFALCLHYSRVDFSLDSVDSQLPPPFAMPRDYTVSELLAENPPENAVHRETGGEYDEEKFESLRKSRQVIRKGGLKLERVIDGQNNLYEIDGFDETLSPEKNRSSLKENLDEYTTSKSTKMKNEESELDGNIEQQLKELGYL
ncbi:sulfatase [Haloferax volcanii]|uniref:Sulfatase n=1 Tax=Haloferax volcanii TaxID=2246 RepID=A0A558GAI1_HALVO|nr:sulfatase [Haloferax volcanii]TVT94770.1 sulfatase [Haloferax volcanii]